MKSMAIIIVEDKRFYNNTRFGFTGQKESNELPGPYEATKVKKEWGS